MLLMPRKVKHRKLHRGGPLRGLAHRGNTLSFGKYGLQAISAGLVSARQIEAARRALTRYVQRSGKVWIRIFPNHPITKKGDETPMGKGKGSVDHFVSRVYTGRVMFEMDGISKELARGAMKLAAHKLNVRSKFVSKE